MKQTNTYLDQAADTFLKNLSSTDPVAYNYLRAQMANNNSMGFVSPLSFPVGAISAAGQKAQKSDSSIWNDITTGIGNLFSKGADLYVSREEAKNAAKIAASQAERALKEAEAKLAIERQKQLSKQRVLELQREAVEIQKQKQALDSELKTKGLMTVVGIGLAALLGIRLMRSF